jgi:hypothetical protein
MKQLILTFFLVIFCYSLFFDKKAEKQPIVDEINYVQKGNLSPQLYVDVPDTMNYFTIYAPTGLIFEAQNQK